MSRRSTAIWCAVVVILGPLLNFVRDWTQEYPFNDHGPAVAVGVAVVLSVALGVVFYPAEARILDGVPSRTMKVNVFVVILLAACLWGAHAGAWMLATWEHTADNGEAWLAAYPAGSVLAWFAVLAVDHEGEPSRT